MGLETMPMVGDYFLPPRLREVLRQVKVSAAEDSSGNHEFTFKSLLENRTLLSEMFRARVWMTIHVVNLFVYTAFALQLSPEQMLSYWVPRVLTISVVLLIHRMGKMTFGTVVGAMLAVSILASCWMIFFPADPALLQLTPFLRYYHTFAAGVPVTSLYAVGFKGAIPFTVASLLLMFGSFYASLDQNAPFFLDAGLHSPLLIYGALVLIIPVFIMKAFDDEAQFYHTLLLKSLRITEQKSKAKTTFISRMSHELRTPLQGLLSSATLLKETKLTDDQMTYISIINSCGDLLLNIMEKILDITRIESGKFETQTQPFSLLSLVPSLLESVVGLSSAKGLDLLLKFDLSARSYVVHGDQKHLKGILTNLIGNAVKFTEKGSVMVTVSVREQPPFLPSSSVSLPTNANIPKSMIYRFEVKDTGKGIPERLLPDLFDPFTKAYNYHHSEGSGLGLSISKRFTEALGGVIGVDTTVGVGSTFWVEIPFQALDPHSIGPSLELPLSSPQPQSFVPPIGVFVRPGILGVIEGYLGHWGLKFEIVEDIHQLKNYSYFIVEEKRLLEARNLPLSMTLPPSGSASSPSNGSEVFLEFLHFLSTPGDPVQQPGNFAKGILLMNFGSSHRMKGALQGSSFYDRISMIPEPFGPSGFRQGVMKLLSQHKLVLSASDFDLSQAAGSSPEDSVTVPFQAVTHYPIFSSSPSSAPFPSLESPPPPPPPPSLPGSEERLDVLLVEDNPVNQAVMKKQFEKLKIKFAITGKAEESLLIWEQCRLGITLILMDIELDGPMTGLEATKIIREKEMQSIGFAPGDAGSRHQQRVKSYIAIMTGRALEEDRREAFSCGCDDFLVKPVALGKVKDLISTLVLDKK